MSHLQKATLLSAQMFNFVQEIGNCMRACEETIQYCLQMGGKHADPGHIRLLSDCVDICRTTLQYTTRRSAYLKRTAALCADLCRDCAASCAQFKDQQMQECAQICMACEASCRQVAS